VHLETDEQPFLLADLPPTQAQIRLAIGIVVALVVAFGATAPFTNIQLARVDPFIPIFITAIIINDLITSALLIANFYIVRRRALLALAGGYFFTALIAIPYALTFPGTFSPTGALGAGLQSTVWLYIFWHLMSPLALLIYALLKDEGSGRSPHGSPTTIICGTAMVAIALVCGLTWFATAGDGLLPAVFRNGVQKSQYLSLLFGGMIALSNAVALTLLWLRRRSVLDLWLMVVCCTSLLEIAMVALLNNSRFSVGWYAARSYGLAASLFVLVVLLSEATTLYAQLARLAMIKRSAREAQRIGMDAMSIAIAHEIRQPLAAISTNASAALRWFAILEKDPSAANEVRSAMKRIIRDTERAAEVMANLRTMFKKEAPDTALLDVNDIVREVLATLDLDLRSQQVSVSTQLADGVPMLRGNRGQLQQVFLNLIVNAIEAMGASRKRILRISSNAIQEPSGVMVVTEDTGIGIQGENKDSIFEPFFTTKAGGTGIGLTICRSIIEAHGGTLEASANKPYGTIFRVALPDGGL
jgi:signal transduction histidine kinase